MNQKNDSYDCVVKPCARCGLDRGMRTRDTVCNGCSNKLYRLVRRKEEEIVSLKDENRKLKINNPLACPCCDVPVIYIKELNQLIELIELEDPDHK